MKGVYGRAAVLALCGIFVLVFYSLFVQDKQTVGPKSILKETVYHDTINPPKERTVQATQQGEKPIAQNLLQQQQQQQQQQSQQAVQQQTNTADYVIPSDEELNAMNEIGWMQIYWKYINRLQILCKDVVRIGSLKDGGKEICVDEPYKPKDPCIVYSFGINYMFDFDFDVTRKFGCQVFCFDPSMTNNSYQVTDKVWFYRLGLGAKNEINNRGWQINTLDTFLASLGHTNRTIDILKIDVEGAEWTSILQMAETGSLDNVKQISIETHFSRTSTSSQKYWGDEKSSKPLIALRTLYELGFRIFMRERNMWSFMPWPGFKGMIANVNEISLIKI